MYCVQNWSWHFLFFWLFVFCQIPSSLSLNCTIDYVGFVTVFAICKYRRTLYEIQILCPILILFKRTEWTRKVNYRIFVEKRIKTKVFFLHEVVHRSFHSVVFGFCFIILFIYYICVTLLEIYQNTHALLHSRTGTQWILNRIKLE